MTVTQEKKEYSISIEPIELTFGAEGGEQEIVVTSSDEWEVTGESDWCYASVASGVDGETVKFSVEPYINTEEARTAIYTFVCGDKAASLNIIQFPDEVLEFEDDNFLQALLNIGIDRNGDGKILKSEASTQKSIFVPSSNISTMDEIKYFTSLERLYCFKNQLTSLDVSHNPNLKVLCCENNQLKSLDVSNNTALTELICYNNQLTTLDVSNNAALTNLYCYENQLTSLDVSNNAALTDLGCNYNQLTSLDVSNNTALTYLGCIKNQLKSLDVSNNTALIQLDCDYNQLTSLDLSNNTALCYLFCSGNQLTKIILSSNHSLEDYWIQEIINEYGDIIEYR